VLQTFNMLHYADHCKLCQSHWTASLAAAFYCSNAHSGLQQIYMDEVDARGRGAAEAQAKADAETRLQQQLAHSLVLDSAKRGEVAAARGGAQSAAAAFK
jgi:hypothetical protein